jgi:hypothetical protein
MAELSQWVAGLPIGLAMRRIPWIIPSLQTLHILAIGIVLSAVVMIDLRIWGASRTDSSVERGRGFLPWLWVAVAVTVFTGIALMIGAPRSWRDEVFIAKMLLMALATAATLALPYLLRRLDRDKGGHPMVGLFAAVTLVLWLGVTLAGRGRWIAALLYG